MDSEEQEILQFLIAMGIIEPLGFSEEHNEEMYRITEKAEDMFPGILDEQMSYINDAVFELWNLEMIDVVFDDSGEPLVGLNKNSLDREKIESIENDELRKAMNAILIAFADAFSRDKE